MQEKWVIQFRLDEEQQKEWDLFHPKNPLDALINFKKRHSVNFSSEFHSKLKPGQNLSGDYEDSHPEDPHTKEYSTSRFIGWSTMVEDENQRQKLVAVLEKYKIMWREQIAKVRQEDGRTLWMMNIKTALPYHNARDFPGTLHYMSHKTMRQMKPPKELEL